MPFRIKLCQNCMAAERTGQEPQCSGRGRAEPVRRDLPVQPPDDVRPAATVQRRKSRRSGGDDAGEDHVPRNGDGGAWDEASEGCQFLRAGSIIATFDYLDLTLTLLIFSSKSC